MEQTENGQKFTDNKKKIVWTIVFLIIAASTIFAIVSNSKTFTVEKLVEYIYNSDIKWMLVSILCMVGFIFFEGEAIYTITKSFGIKTKHRRGIIYSMADIYFSAITPSATGGQPASAYFMVKDGMPLLSVTAILHLNLVLYTFSIIVIGFIAFILFFDVFMTFGVLSKILIVVGYLLQIVLMAFFILLKKESLLQKIGKFIIKLLSKLHIIKDEDKHIEKLNKITSDYSQFSGLIVKNRKMIFKAFIYNLLQRISIIAVPVFVFLATGGEVIKSLKVFAVQSYSVVGANTIPIPGAMGVMDAIMLDGFRNIVSTNDVINFELVSRSLSFYFCMLLCGFVVLIRYLVLRRRERLK